MIPRSEGNSDGESFLVRSSSNDWNGTTGLGDESVERGLWKMDFDCSLRHFEGFFGVLSVPAVEMGSVLIHQDLLESHSARRLPEIDDMGLVL